MSREESKKKFKRKRKPPWILGGIVLLLLTFLFILQTSNVWKGLQIDSASETLLLYGLSSLNFIAFIIFAFILIRSLLKLRQERRALQMGAKIKTRLLVYFAAISLLPLIAMAGFSYLFMNRAVERWFTQIPENVVREAGEMQTRNYRDRLEKFEQTTKMLARALENREVSSADLEEIARAGNLLHLEIISAEGETLIETSGNRNPAAAPPPARQQRQRLEKYLAGIKRQISAQTAPAASAAPAGENPTPGGFVSARAEMSAGRNLLAIIDIGSAENLTQIAGSSLQKFDTLKTQNIFVRQIGLTTLGLLTFLLIFAASWFAFYVAKGLARPIRALAEGADEIARGNFSHRVDVFAEDELDLLVRTFNEMSARIEENSAELEERRKYIETVLQSLSTGVISFDETGRVTTINKAAVRMFRLGEADFANLELTQLVGEENRLILESLIARAGRIGQASEQTVLQKREFMWADGAEKPLAEGENLPVALTATSLPGKTGVVLVIEDLSELIAAQRATAWQEIARRMAHEIKNPLTPIQLSAERIAKRFAHSNGERKFSGENYAERDRKIIKDGTDTILREVSSLKSMVDEFSRYARLPQAKPRRGDLNELIRQTAALYEDRSRSVEINLSLSEKLPEILIDAEQLKRVFVNLIDNSFEAFEETQAEKNIFIKTFHDPARDLVVAEVADNGRGIDPSGFQKLFQPYFSTKGRETGLGLAIVQRIIGEHSGKIKVVANTPKGAKFIIELPSNV